MKTTSALLTLCALFLCACGGAEEPSDRVPAADPAPASSGGESAPASTTQLECELQGAGTISVAAPDGAVVRPNETGCVVFLGEGSDPAAADLVAQWGAVPSEGESAEAFVRSQGMLGEIEVIDQNEVDFLGAPNQVSHVNAPSPPGIGDAREGWIVWASRGDANVMAIVLCRPGDATCAASASAMISGSR